MYTGTTPKREGPKEVGDWLKEQGAFKKPYSIVIGWDYRDTSIRQNLLDIKMDIVKEQGVYSITVIEEDYTIQLLFNDATNVQVANFLYKHFPPCT